MFAPDVETFVRVLAPSVKRKVREGFDRIRKDPFHPELDLKLLRKIRSERVLRARVAKDYRIVYSPRRDHTYVWRVQHRREGYDWLERLFP